MKNGSKLKKNLMEALTEFLGDEIAWDGDTPLMRQLAPNHREQVREHEGNLKGILADLQRLEGGTELSVRVQRLEEDTRFIMGNVAEAAYIQGFLAGMSGGQSVLKDLIRVIFTSEEAAA